MCCPRWPFLLALALALPPSVVSHGLARRDDPAGPPAAALKEVNDACRAAYRAARQRWLDRAGPIVLWDSDTLIFRHGKQRQLSRPTPALYHDLKTVGHVVLALHALLAEHDGPLDEASCSAAKKLEAVARTAREAIRQRGLTKEQFARQDKILAPCASYLARVACEKRAENKDMLKLLQALRPYIEANNFDAARAQIDGLHREMQAYRKKLSSADWKNLVVIVQGTQPPRKDNLAVQYFARLLGEPGEGRRIVYAEAIFDEARALALLGTRGLDTRLGTDLFANPGRFHRDLLGDAAKKYLDELFARDD